MKIGLQIFVLAVILMYGQLLSTAEREIAWCGQQWLVKSAPERGPGPNAWSDTESSVWIDDKSMLHIKLREESGRWFCPEISSKAVCGYGTYHFELASQVNDLDPQLVLGLFAYADDDNEVDVEFSNWGEAGPPKRQFVVQPYHKPGYLSKASALGLGPGLKYSLDWRPDRIVCTETLGESKRVWLFQQAAAEMPKADQAHMHINLWLFRGQAPLNKREQEVVIKRAWFVPYTVTPEASP